MAFNDLSAEAQDGLNYKASINLRSNGIPYYATGRLYADAQMETLGQQAYAEKLEAKRKSRIAKLEANLVLLTQVDALPDVP